MQTLQISSNSHVVFGLHLGTTSSNSNILSLSHSQTLLMITLAIPSPYSVLHRLSFSFKPHIHLAIVSVHDVNVMSFHVLSSRPFTLQPYAALMQLSNATCPPRLKIVRSQVMVHLLYELCEASWPWSSTSWPWNDITLMLFIKPNTRKFSALYRSVESPGFGARGHEPRRGDWKYPLPRVKGPAGSRQSLARNENSAS